VTFTDYVEAGTMLARELKSKGCHCVIALTHMRTPNDVRLAENVAEIDLILGGHDHVYEKKKVGTLLLLLLLLVLTAKLFLFIELLSRVKFRKCSTL
jgi:hypothetical protein